MLNIKYKGKYLCEEQLKEGYELIEYSGTYKALPTSKPIIFHYIVPFIALFVVTITSLKYQIDSAMDIDLYNTFTLLLNNNVLKGKYISLMVFSLVLMSFVHELIHCLFYPIKAEKQIYSRLPYNLIVHCGEKMFKNRFLFMVLAPCIILGVIPFILCSIVIWRINPLLSLYTTLLSSALMGSSLSDCLIAYRTITQVPTGAKIFNYGIDFYWIN